MELTRNVLGRFIRQVILEGNDDEGSRRLPSGIRGAKNFAAAVRTFEVIQSYVKGANTIGEFLDNLPVGSKVWQWDENIAMKDGVFVIKNVKVGRRPKNFHMVLKKHEDGRWDGPIYFKMPVGINYGWDPGQFLYFWVELMAKPESAPKFEKAARNLELPIVIGASDLKPENNDIGSFIITKATHVPDWADDTGPVDTMMIFSDVNIPIFLENAKKNPFMASFALKMFGVSIPDPAFGSDGVIPVNMAALNQYQETGTVTLEIHQGGDVFEVDLVKDPKTGRPVAYPKIPL